MQRTPAAKKAPPGEPATRPHCGQPAAILHRMLGSGLVVKVLRCGWCPQWNALRPRPRAEARR